MITQTLDYSDGDVSLEAYLAFEESEHAKPLILVSHDWSGRRRFACEAAERIAQMGYVAMAIDMYGKGVFGADNDVELNSSLMHPFTEDRSMLRRRINAALEAGRALEQVDKSKVAAIGYCFGGMCVLELARSGAALNGVVSIHGILTLGNVPNEAITAKVLCLHGHDDPMVPPSQVLEFETEMNDAGVDWQLHAYGNTFHAFTNPSADNPDLGVAYNAVAERRSYIAMKSFFDEIFA